LKNKLSVESPEKFNSQVLISDGMNGLNVANGNNYKELLLSNSKSKSYSGYFKIRENLNESSADEKIEESYSRKSNR
jgi:hypothetical protein